MNSNFLTTSLIWGIIYMIIFLFPLFYYTYRFFFKKNNGEEINPIQVVFTGLILHILIALTLIIFSYILNALNVNNFSPCKGIRFFLFGISPNNSCSNIINVNDKIIWNIWYDIYKNSISNFSNPIDGAKKIISGTIYSLSLVLYFVLNSMLVMMIAYPFIYFFKEKEKYNRYQQEKPSIFKMVFNSIIVAIFLYFVIYLHFLIDTNMTKNICNISGFDAFDLARKALRSFLGISK